MRVSIEQEANVVTYNFELEPGDREAIVSPTGQVKARFLGGPCRYFMPEGWRLEDVHPDLIAAVAMMVAGNFIGKQMELPFGVSQEFQEQMATIYKRSIGPADTGLKLRRPPPGARLGLCFSGGVDSAAAMLLLPTNTTFVFLHRIDRPDGQQKSIYKPDAAVRACDVLRTSGREVLCVQTDMEYTRHPVGFMNDGTMATPQMLLADWLKLDGIAYGMILESAYLNKGFRYREYKQTDHWRRYGGTAAACGLPWHLVTAGLSEVATSQLVLESPLQHVAQSCVRGAFGSPCMKCWKCFRKSLLEAALVGETIPSAKLDEYFQINEIAHKLLDIPIKHENVMMYLLQKYQGNNREMLDLRRELHLEEIDLSWMERWFTTSREVLADNYRDQTEADITRLIKPMNEQDISNVRAWDRLAANEAAGRLIPTNT